MPPTIAQRTDDPSGTTPDYWTDSPAGVATMAGWANGSAGVATMAGWTDGPAGVATTAGTAGPMVLSASIWPPSAEVRWLQPEVCRLMEAVIVAVRRSSG